MEKSTREKALEIANKMYEGNVFSKTKSEHLEELENAKRRALIVVDEIIESHEMAIGCEDIVLNYWKEVKKEIPNL